MIIVLSLPKLWPLGRDDTGDYHRRQSGGLGYVNVVTYHLLHLPSYRGDRSPRCFLTGGWTVRVRGDHRGGSRGPRPVAWSLRADEACP